MADRFVSVPMTLNDLLPAFQATTLFEVEYLVLGTKLLQHTNRKLYLTYLDKLIDLDHFSPILRSLY